MDLRRWVWGIGVFWAAGQVSAEATYQAIQKTLGIPTAVATIVDASDPSDQVPQIILIQDIHRHTEAQQNISAMILYGLRHWETKEILVEGSWAQDDTLKKSVHRFPSLLDAVREGRMGGAEMAVAMTPEKDFRFLGLEDPDVYRKNVDAYEAVAKVREDALRELETSGLLGRIFDAAPSSERNRVKRFIQLRLKPAEYAEYLKSPYHAPLHSNLAVAVAAAETFYELANERSRIFLEKAKALHQSGPQVLVVGGFHTTGMTEQLRREGISYVVLAPQVTQGGFDELYTQGMHDTISALKLH